MKYLDYLRVQSIYGPSRQLQEKTKSVNSGKRYNRIESSADNIIAQMILWKIRQGIHPILNRGEIGFIENSIGVKIDTNRLSNYYIVNNGNIYTNSCYTTEAYMNLASKLPFQTVLEIQRLMAVYMDNRRHVR